VTVTVECHGDRRVTYKLLDELGVVAAGEQQRGAGVPEVMGADARQPSPPEQRFEGGRGEVAEAQVPAVVEVEAVVFSEVPDLEPFGVLDGLVGTARETNGVRTNIERALIG
jgi:hypothetical protein